MYKNRKTLEFEQMIDKNSNLAIMFSMLSNIIIPENLPAELQENFKLFLIETICLNCGFIVKDVNGKLHYTFGTTVDPWDDFGYGRNFITHTHMGKEFTGELHKDGCVIYPFSSRRKLNKFEKTAEKISEIETSEEFLIKWSRVAPFLLCSDNKTKEGVKELVISVMNGNLTPILSENFMKQLVNNGDSEVITKLSLFEPDRIRDLQYLHEAKEHTMKELFELFGMPCQTSTKMAQQSIDEINAKTGTCFVIPYDLITNFNNFADDLNKTFNLNVSFKLNPLILREMEKYFNQGVENESENENESEVENYETGENLGNEIE